MLASIAVAVALTGCESRNDRETGDVGRDTTITSERVQDTTIVTADTSIDVDTVSTTDNIDRAKE
ncbi:MAG: hypothetical protein H0T50_00285 [Gemmatimonadales bacterium]|nr:hypothetical protein [Gemmatimonadales bacterium]